MSRNNIPDFPRQMAKRDENLILNAEQSYSSLSAAESFKYRINQLESLLIDLQKKYDKNEEISLGKYDSSLEFRTTAKENNDEIYSWMRRLRRLISFLESYKDGEIGIDPDLEEKMDSDVEDVENENKKRRFRKIRSAIIMLAEKILFKSEKTN